MNFFKRIFKRKNPADKFIRGFKKMDIETLCEISRALNGFIVNKKINMLASANKPSMEKLRSIYASTNMTNSYGDYYDSDLETIDLKDKTLEELLCEHGVEDPRMDRLAKKVTEAKKKNN